MNLTLEVSFSFNSTPYLEIYIKRVVSMHNDAAILRKMLISPSLSKPMLTMKSKISGDCPIKEDMEEFGRMGRYG